MATPYYKQGGSGKLFFGFAPAQTKDERAVQAEYQAIEDTPGLSDEQKLTERRRIFAPKAVEMQEQLDAEERQKKQILETRKYAEKKAAEERARAEADRDEERKYQAEEYDRRVKSGVDKEADAYKESLKREADWVAENKKNVRMAPTDSPYPDFKIGPVALDIVAPDELAKKLRDHGVNVRGISDVRKEHETNQANQQARADAAKAEQDKAVKTAGAALNKAQEARSERVNTSREQVVSRREFVVKAAEKYRAAQAALWAHKNVPVDPESDKVGEWNTKAEVLKQEEAAAKRELDRAESNTELDTIHRDLAVVGRAIEDPEAAALFDQIYDDLPRGDMTPNELLTSINYLQQFRNSYKDKIPPNALAAIDQYIRDLQPPSAPKPMLGGSPPPVSDAPSKNKNLTAEEVAAIDKRMIYDKDPNNITSATIAEAGQARRDDFRINSAGGDYEEMRAEKYKNYDPHKQEVEIVRARERMRILLEEFSDLKTNPYRHPTTDPEAEIVYKSRDIDAARKELARLEAAKKEFDQNSTMGLTQDTKNDIAALLSAISFYKNYHPEETEYIAKLTARLDKLKNTKTRIFAPKRK